MKQLTPREARFVAEYLVNGGKGQAAAIAAGYAPKNAKVTASRLLKRAHIMANLEQRNERVLHRAEVTAAEVIEGFARIARADIRKLYHADGSLKEIHELDDDTAAAIAGIEQEDIRAGAVKVGTLRKIKRWDAVKAWESLARILGMFNDTITLKGDFAERLVKARERSRQART